MVAEALEAHYTSLISICKCIFECGMKFMLTYLSLSKLNLTYWPTRTTISVPTSAEKNCKMILNADVDAKWRWKLGSLLELVCVMNAGGKSVLQIVMLPII